MSSILVMELSEIKNISSKCQTRAGKILKDSNFIEILEQNGLRVNLIGSLKMGLMVNHLDIDFHIYSKNITVESSFMVISKLAVNPNVIETICVNRLNTDEHCMEWHLKYKDDENDVWQIDIIHIEEGTEYDGFFERMAEKICEVITPLQRDTIMRLKYLSSNEDKIQIHGAEIYEAVIEHNIVDFENLKEWILKRRKDKPYFWTPK